MFTKSMIIKGASGRRALNVSGIFSISPTLAGLSTWDLTANGNLYLNSLPGQHRVLNQAVWTIIPQTTFQAQVKLWGAAGATGFNYGISASNARTNRVNGIAGGGGGAAVGIINFEAGVEYIIAVGTGGYRYGEVASIALPGATWCAGGVNQVNRGGSCGGGYSAIFRTSSMTQANVLLLAGGGGGGGHNGNTADTTYTGGNGGGDNGASSYWVGSNETQQKGHGGSQIAGGTASIYNSASAGTALMGGTGAHTASSSAGLSGGGGGYFGGGGGNIGGGGGGSGRVGTHANVISGTLYSGNRAQPGNASDPDKPVGIGLGVSTGATTAYGTTATFDTSGQGGDGYVLIKKL